MEYRVVFTDSYHEELQAVVRYLVDASGSAASADRLLSAVDNMIDLLSVTPELKAVSAKSSLMEREMREWFTCNYVIVYRFDGEVVYLEHIFHQLQDYERLL